MIITWPRSAEREGAVFGEQSGLCYPCYIGPITLLHSNHKAWAAGQKCPLSLPPPFNIFSFSQLERLDGLFGRKGANSLMQIGTFHCKTVIAHPFLLMA